MTQEQLDILYLARKAIDNYLPQVAAQAREINQFAPLIREWIAGTAAMPLTYEKDELRCLEGHPYKCTMTHTHSGEEGWDPLTGSALWRRYHGTTPEMAWEFLADAANPYLKDEYCIENEKIYKCLIDNTVYAPSILPSNWEKFEDNLELENKEEGSTTVNEILPWKQPDGSNPYKKDAKVSHNGKIWISTTNGNVWEPGIYGWEEVTE